MHLISIEKLNINDLKKNHLDINNLEAFRHIHVYLFHDQHSGFCSFWYHFKRFYHVRFLFYYFLKTFKYELNSKQKRVLIFVTKFKLLVVI